METWKVAIALSMSSNHTAVLSALSSSLLGVHAQVNKLESGFSRLKLAIGGALSVTAGMALFGVMQKIVDKTKDYSDELVKLQRLGGDMAPAVASGAMSRQAFDIAQRVPMTVADLLKIPGATYSILGQEGATKTWEDMARFSWVLQSQKDYKGDPGHDLQDLIRAGELAGRITDPVTHQADPERTKHFLDLATRVIAATHGMVNPQTLLGMAKQGGFTLRDLSDEGFYTQAIMAQAMGGPRAGTAYLSLWQQMAGGTMFTRTAEGMEAVGLLKPSDWHTDHGRVILHDDASRRLTKLIGKDPLDLAANLVEHFKQTGVTDPGEQMRLVMRALGRQTTQRYTAEEVTNFHQMLAERGRLAQGMGVDSSLGLINNQSVTANMEALKNAWTNLLTAVAGSNSENVIAVLQSLTSHINAATKSINQMNPETLKNIGIGLGVLSAALVGGGIVAITAALGPAGWIAAGLIALGGAAAMWGPKIQVALDAVRDFLLNLQQRVIGGIMSMGDAIYNALKEIWDKVIAMFKGGGGGQFKKDLDDANKNYVPMRFEPGKDRGRGSTLAINLNVDGKRLASAITEVQEGMSGFPTQAASNGLSLYNGGGI